MKSKHVFIFALLLFQLFIIKISAQSALDNNTTTTVEMSKNQTVIFVGETAVLVIPQLWVEGATHRPTTSL
ncbi:hypothetical protein JW935_05540 [candidate division KSB1 bacterium]|nr:hypothetical protein [candidate division KSB1 bacterium]